MKRLLGSLVLPLGACLLSLASAGVTLLELREKEAQVQRVGRERQLVTSRIGQLEKRLADSKRRVREMLTRVPDAPDVTDVLSAIQRCEARSGIRLASIQVPEGPSDGKQGYELHGAGTANALAGFLSLLEGLPRILLVRSLQIRAHPELRIEFEIRLDAFHRLEER